MIFCNTITNVYIYVDSKYKLNYLINTKAFKLIASTEHFFGDNQSKIIIVYCTLLVHTSSIFYCIYLYFVYTAGAIAN